MRFERIATSLVGVALVVSVVIGCGAGSRDAGDEPVSVTLDVAGMTCESCEAAIVHSVGQIDGVDMVESRHVTGTTTVLYRPGKVSREAIVETIEGLGYKVLAPEG